MGISIMEGKAEAEQRSWSDLPRDALFLIFQKLGAIEVLLAAQAVCTSWRQLALEPQLWHCIDLRLKPSNLNDCLVEKLTFVAINRSDRYIEEFYAGGFIWDDTFTYIANRTTGLRSFALISPRGFTEKGLVDFICQCPLLEQLEITDYSISPEFYRKIGRACPKLKCFQLNSRFIIHEDWDSNSEADRNGKAFEIASNLPELHALQLIGNPLSNKGPEAVVDKCLYLESLDMRDCSDVFVGAKLKTKLDKIKSVTLPFLYKGMRDRYDVFVGAKLKAKLDKIESVRLPFLYKGMRDCYDVFVGAKLKAKLDKIKSVRLSFLYKGNKSDKVEPVQKNWAELPHDILFLIFRKLGAIEVLLAAQAVCTSWRQLALDPHVWRSIDLRLKPRNLNDCLVEKLTRVAVDRCNGYMEEFYTEGFIWDDTFTYIASRTAGLRCLALISPYGFTRNALVEFIRQCPLLEELEIVDYSISLPEDLLFTRNFLINPEAYRDIGQACPRLKSLSLSRRYIIHEGWYSNSDTVRNGEALEIANSMPQLRKLELIANPLTDKGLHAILEKCSQLEFLDIRWCYNVNIVAGLKEKLNEIKTVGLPERDNDYDITLVRSCLTALPSVPPDRRRGYFCDFDELYRLAWSSQQN